MQKRRVPSGFLTNNTGEPYGDLEGRIILFASSSLSYSAIKFYSPGDTLYKRRLGMLAFASKLI